MPRNPRSNLLKAYDAACNLPREPPAPAGLDVAKLRELEQQGRAAHKRFRELLDVQAIDQQIKSELARLVLEALRCLNASYRLAFDAMTEQTEWIVEQASRLSSKVESHRKGPRLKRERVEKRHKAMDEAMAAGITEEQEVLRFMQEHYPELIRKGKKDSISAKQMMSLYRQARAR